MLHFSSHCACVVQRHQWIRTKCLSRSKEHGLRCSWDFTNSTEIKDSPLLCSRNRLLKPVSYSDTASSYCIKWDDGHDAGAPPPADAWILKLIEVNGQESERWWCNPPAARWKSTICPHPCVMAPSVCRRCVIAIFSPFVSLTCSEPTNLCCHDLVHTNHRPAKVYK